MILPTDWVVTFPTLGDLWDAWVQAHCLIPDGYRRGEAFVWSDWQFWCAANFGRIRAGLQWENIPLGARAFTYRRLQVIAPQKTGKGPWAASMTAIQAVGPAEFDGWASAGDSYRCSDWGCSCGFVFPYQAGEPKGRPHPSPLIQLTATSEDQVENTYRPLRAMIQMGPLRHQMAVRDGFVRILGGLGGDDADRIDAVTASADSRVGNPVTFCEQDETGLWTKRNRMTKVADAQRRGLAGMGGRAIETTNAYDSAEQSVAQTTLEANLADVATFYIPPPKHLKWERKRDRRRILEAVYKGSPWVNIDTVLAEADEISLRDPEQAERFFGNRITYSSGSWLPAGLWEEHYAMAGESP
nr:MAG TPA: Large Terminase [Caudoviricetes sp.]